MPTDLDLKLAREANRLWVECVNGADVPYGCPTDEQLAKAFAAIREQHENENTER